MVGGGGGEGGRGGGGQFAIFSPVSLNCDVSISHSCHDPFCDQNVCSAVESSNFKSLHCHHFAVWYGYNHMQRCVEIQQHLRGEGGYT